MMSFSWLKRVFQRKQKPKDDARLQELQKEVERAERVYREEVEPQMPLIKPRLSKTKISVIQARMKNVERRKSSMRKHKGKFKPKPAPEKRLWKPDAKPEED